MSSAWVTDHDNTQLIEVVHASEIPPNMVDRDDGDNKNLYTYLVQAARITYPSPGQENISNALLDSKDTLDYLVDSVISSKRKPKLTPKDLFRKWCLSLDTANSTTQSGMQNIFLPLDQKVQINTQWLKYPSINFKMYRNAMHSKVPGISGETGTTILTNGKEFDPVYPWTTKDEYAKSLIEFIHDIGIPKTLVTDEASEKQKVKGCKVADLHNVNLKVMVPSSLWQNLAEASVQECKSMTHQLMHHPCTCTHLDLCSQVGYNIAAIDCLIHPLPGRSDAN